MYPQTTLIPLAAIGPFPEFDRRIPANGEWRTAKGVAHSARYFNATTKLVTIMLASASGSRNFQPNAINWS